MAHSELTALLPWYVNRTLDESQRSRVEEHLAECASCRHDLELERAVQRLVTAGPGVEYLPAPSLKKLQARLDASESPVAGVQPEQPPLAGRPAWLPWRSLAAAAVVAASVVLGVLTLAERPAPVPQSYRTVTSPTQRAPDEVIRAVFVPSITLVELQALLEQSGLRIVAGPTEAGVYSLAANSARPVGDSLALLRRHDSVRFAESTEPPSSSRPTSADPAR